MASSCELLDAELALDRVEAEVARELPPHVRAFAEAYAAGRREPAAPSVLTRPATIGVAQRALPHPLLADRALALLRLVAPLAIHVAPGGDYGAFRAARDGISQRVFGMSALELVHRLHGSDRRSVNVSVNVNDRLAELARWRTPDGRAVDPAAAWRELAARHGVTSHVSFVAGAQRARTFVVGPSECVVAIPPQIDSPSSRFMLMHELGHVLAAALSPPGIPRTLDEAVAVLVAITDEPIDVAARARRLSRARELDAIERGISSAPAEIPWPLWHDPGAQAAYVVAERLADELAAAPDLRGAIASIRSTLDV